MRLAQASIVVATVALGVALALYFRVEELKTELGNARAAPQAGIREVPAAPGADWAPRVDHPGPGTGGPAPAASPGSAAGSAAEGRALAAPAPPLSLEERIAKLERQQSSLRAGGGAPLRFSDRYAGSVDDLSRQLSLTSTQRARVEDAVARGRQRVEDILKIPDETGKSPFERRAEQRRRLEEAMKSPKPDRILAFATDLTSYRSHKIPGRNETYGAAIQRVRDETREEIKSALDASQEEAFAGTHIDGLLGEAGQHVSVAYAVGTEIGEAAAIGVTVEEAPETK